VFRTLIRNPKAIVALTFVTLILAAATASAGIRRYELDAGGVPETPAAWQASGRVASAPDHALQPRLTLDPAPVLEIELPDAGTLRFSPLGIRSDDDAPIELPAGAGQEIVFSPERPHALTIRESFWGVDERYLLRSTGLKHDLVIHADALRLLGGGDLIASWLVELPDAMTMGLDERGGAEMRDSEGVWIAHVPAPTIVDSGGGHAISGIARLELGALAGQTVLELVVPATWVHDPARVFPLYIDPSVNLEPTDMTRTGSVDNFGLRLEGGINSGSLLSVGLGDDVRGFAQFDTSSIPDTANVTGVRIQFWIANHDNPGDPASDLIYEIHPVASTVDVANADLYAAIGPPVVSAIYATNVIGSTGPDYCPLSFVPRDENLGAVAVADLTALLPLDYFTVGFANATNLNPVFDHLDLIGYPEEVLNPACPSTDFPGTRIRLVVDIREGDCTPRNHGFWHRYCLGQGVIDPGRNGNGNGPDPSPQHEELPPGLLAIADGAMAAHGLSACQALDEGPFSDARLAALRELATVHLNMAGGWLRRGCAIELHPVDKTPDLTVGDGIARMETLLIEGSERALRDARWIGEHIVNGEALVAE